ncbi:hypothetical protein [Syntrophaceticus schinkii]|uniref:Antitoxin SocA-like Panacea domain-containing protein n=1 Tax=Syntrophaceticus schinkii TaxID=499207 RepID=A0A0B7ML86_9FIRM|nr:hypothetical protein [Syntrophaceticus schinkii]CEO88711.1 hypothetical protein SSCH_2430001 [Syntrophaceticus schinkii]
MLIGFKERWDQYGLIAYLTEKLKGVSPQFGKTVLQKLVYIMQEVYELPTDYDYILYNYGPYCSELNDDLSYAALLDGVNIDWSGIGYKISPSEKTEHYINKAKDFFIWKQQTYRPNNTAFWEYVCQRFRITFHNHFCI